MCLASQAKIRAKTHGQKRIACNIKVMNSPEAQVRYIAVSAFFRPAQNCSPLRLSMNGRPRLNLQRISTPPFACTSKPAPLFSASAAPPPQTVVRRRRLVRVRLALWNGRSGSRRSKRTWRQCGVTRSPSVRRFTPSI